MLWGGVIDNFYLNIMRKFALQKPAYKSGFRCKSIC